jgi:hypothetical protein
MDSGLDGHDPALTLPAFSASVAQGRQWLPGPARASARRAALWILPLSFLAVFFFLPLARILAFSFDLGTLSAANLKVAFEALGFTVYQAVL